MNSVNPDDPHLDVIRALLNRDKIKVQLPTNNKFEDYYILSSCAPTSPHLTECSTKHLASFPSSTSIHNCSYGWVPTRTLRAKRLASRKSWSTIFAAKFVWSLAKSCFCSNSYVRMPWKDSRPSRSSRKAESQLSRPRSAANRRRITMPTQFASMWQAERARGWLICCCCWIWWHPMIIFFLLLLF